MKKRIEVALPLREINNLSIAESLKKGHPGNLHMWWSRSPIESSTMLLKELLEDIISDKNKVLPIICDPFSGFGGLAIAAQKLGVPIEASDLNSVATLITKAACEINSRFSDNRAFNSDAENRMYFRNEGLAADVKYYGQILQEKVWQKLKDYYPNVSIGSENANNPVYAWIWVRTMKCPNPACGCQMPMANSYVLSKMKGNEYWAEPKVSDKELYFEIHKGVCPDGKESNKHGSKGSKFQCPFCGEIVKDNDIKQAGLNNEIDVQMMSVSTMTTEGRIYLKPDTAQIDSANVVSSGDNPIGSIPNNSRWFSPPLFGKTEYTDLFTSRQLLLLDTFCELIPDIISLTTKEAITAGMIEDNISLADGGSGALAYGQAIGVYLSLVISKLTNYQSEMCTWDNRKGNIRAAFTRQALPMTWVFAEGNPFDKATGNYDAMLNSVVETILSLPNSSKVKVTQTDALMRDYPENAVLFTELPYYDNVGYADLSDYFYVWLRKCLNGVYPKLFEKVVTSKEELCSIPEHYNGDSSKATETYRTGIKKFFERFYQSASKDYPSVAFYEYTKDDDTILNILEGDSNESSFEYILTSIVDAGFSISAVWPVRTEKAGDTFDSIRIAIVFRKKEQLKTITRRGFITTLKRELPEVLETAFTGIDDYDKSLTGIGFGLSIYTNYKKVINADGSNMRIHDALLLIFEEVESYLAIQSDDVRAEEE